MEHSTNWLGLAIIATFLLVMVILMFIAKKQESTKKQNRH